HVAFADVVTGRRSIRCSSRRLCVVRTVKFRLFGTGAYCGLRVQQYLAGLCLDIDFPFTIPNPRLKGTLCGSGSDVSVIRDFDFQMNWYDGIDGPSHHQNRYQLAAIIDDDWRPG